MKIAYIEHRFSTASKLIIEQANAIVEEYKGEGITMTLRGIYYKFIARDWFPESWIDEEYNKRKGLDPRTKNTIKNYDKLQDLLSKARLAGQMSWLGMVDVTRNLEELAAWESPDSALAAVAQQYREDLWADQKNRVEVWIEKDALVGTIDSVCQELRVPYFACRGYTSQSEQWKAGMRLRRHIQEGYRPVILHFGDHDPSGIDMTRDNTDRLSMFAGGDITFKRMALNMNQIRKYNPPPNPTKLTDSRTEGYVREYGEECWELDALEPRVLRGLIKTEVGKLRDKKIWDASAAREAGERATLGQVSDGYVDIKKWLPHTEAINQRLEDDTL